MRRRSAVKTARTSVEATGERRRIDDFLYFIVHRDLVIPGVSSPQPPQTA